MRWLVVFLFACGSDPKPTTPVTSNVAVAAPDTAMPTTGLPDLSAVLNTSCSDGSACPDGLTCGGKGEKAGQCIVENCPTKGPGLAHGCPSNGFCYVYDRDEGHYCTRVCKTDEDCTAVNRKLVCRERSATEDDKLKICVRG